ncbi:ATP-dependent RNA helicase RhlE [hydrothermal vent metagenome]|uniref:ATP-dependent RNA helicase RhlE n=1 Tax=hydrothermal vent metagenome TaxID=652676 RepID=A0A1W1DQY2_9ZZZZ
MVDDFVPDHDVPESLKKQLPPKNKKPKKNKPRNKPRYGKDSDSKGKKPNKKRSFWDAKPKKKSQK